MSNAKDVVFRGFTSVHRAVFKVTKGRLLGKMAGMPAVLLVTTGRRSGQPRETILTAPIVEDDGRVVLIASYGGDPRHPAWFLNLREHPDVEVTMGGSTRPMRARIAATEEKDELWPRVVRAYKGYAGYQRRTERDIPVVILEPVS